MGEIAKPRSRRGGPPSFDITCVIGTVTYGDDPEAPSPHVAAFMLIGEHDSPGVFSFPAADGSTCVVDVSYKQPTEAAGVR